ncbi:MAG TPA: TonB-dependent receptor, partial [Longimicrobiaceae bacterium]|nr:TonB-dependent receptor [Longimicrobiaceae bacterium]
NTAFSLRYRGRLGGSASEVGVAWSGFDAHLPSTSPAGGGTSRVRATADFTRGEGPVRVGYGTSLDRMWLRSEGRDAESRTGGAYLEGSWQPIPRLRVRGGMRGDLFSADPDPRFSPRLAVTWLPGEQASLSLAAGRYHQIVRAWDRVESTRPGRIRPDSVFIPAGLAVGRASHLSLALHQQMEPGIRLGVEGFFKTFEGLAVPGMERAHTSGVDLWVRREAGALRGWLGYSLAWVWSPPTGGTRQVFDGRHTLSAAVAGTLGRWGDADLRVAYGADLPYTAIHVDQESTELGARMEVLAQSVRGATESLPFPTTPGDSYLRVDLGISRTFTPRWQGRATKVSPYLRVLNALGRRDALFYDYRHGRDAEPRPLAALPLIPVVGVSWQI